MSLLRCLPEVYTPYVYILQKIDRLLGNASTPMAKVEWTCMDEENWILDDYSLKPLQPPSHSTADGDALDHHDYTLVVTGDVFRWMINHAPLETLQRVSFEVRTGCPGINIAI